MQADKSRIARVISNLLSNAIKFTSEGIITISVEKDETDENEKNCVNINVKILVKVIHKIASKSYHEIKSFERKRSIDVPDILEEWIMINGKPKRIMHDNDKQFTSKIFKLFLEHNNIKDKPIPNSYPQLQGKVEAYNKVVKDEFISVEQISSIDEGNVRYDMFVKEYNDKREHGGINGLTPSEMFLQTFNRSDNSNNYQAEKCNRCG